MKKVLFITTISGFLPQFEKNDVKLLEQMGCEIHYASNFKNPIYNFDEKELAKKGIISHHIDIEKSPVKLLANFKAIRQIREIIESNAIDMVHCHNPMGGVAGRIAAACSKQKPYVIYTAHGFHFYKGAPILNWLLYYPAERLLSRFTDQIITINGEDYRSASTFPLRRGGCVTQIHSVGVDRERFKCKKEREESKRRELEIPQEAFHIVTAAELNQNKNQQVVIRAIARLKDQNVYYSICGRGPWEKELKELITQLHLSDRVKLLGYCTDMEEILQTADCFAFPSRREGLGIASVEALLCEVPLIVADNRGSREYAVDGYNSIVCDADSVEDFENAIKLLSKNMQLRREMASHCRESAKRFTIEEVEMTMKEVYKKALLH